MIFIKIRCIDCGKEINGSPAALSHGECPECRKKSNQAFNDMPWQDQGVWMAERQLKAEMEIRRGFAEADEEM